MGRKVFISYKYSDTRVNKINDLFYEYDNGNMRYKIRKTRVRDYVDIIQDKIGKDNINLGEKDGESLDEFSDQKIETLLKQRIRQCSITIVMISKGMKDEQKFERAQWIPWEVSYSLRVVATDGNNKQRNAILGIVLPDENNSYDWYYLNNVKCNCVTHYTEQLFRILKNNMFNIKRKAFRECDNLKIYTNDEPSYIKTVKWDEFMLAGDYNIYIDKAVLIKENEDDYEIQVNLD